MRAPEPVRQTEPMPRAWRLEKLAQQREAVLASPDAPPSPCVSICKIDPKTQWCQGCYRTLPEIAAWSRMDDAARREVWAVMGPRLENAA